jgi:S1-C subfamily serine protease
MNRAVIWVWGSMIEACSGSYQTVARDELELDPALTVTQVAPGSPAARSRLQVGDLVPGVSDKAALGSPGAVEDFNRLISAAVEDGTIDL